MTTPKLFLFDLDGTLVSTGGAGLRALRKAFKELYGIEDAHKKINPSGKTDPAIFREILRASIEREATSNEISTISSCYLKHLEFEMKMSITKPLNGVKKFLELISSQTEIIVGLGTGNLEKGARLKLGPVNLNTFFPFGGFGSDAEDRADVLKCGHRRANDRIGHEIRSDQVFIIGDTLLDISAAKRAGFRSVAVASGGVSFEELQSGNPDFLMKDLNEGPAFMESL